MLTKQKCLLSKFISSYSYLRMKCSTPAHPLHHGLDVGSLLRWLSLRSHSHREVPAGAATVSGFQFPVCCEHHPCVTGYLKIILHLNPLKASPLGPPALRCSYIYTQSGWKRSQCLYLQSWVGVQGSSASSPPLS